VTGVDGPVSLTTGGGATAYYHRDMHGSISDVTSAAGAALWAYGYEPYGAARTASKLDANAPGNPLRYTGQYLDAASGQYHLRARQYDPASGRFTATDPVTAPIDDPYVSAYAYANDKPTTLSDPSGLTPGCGPLGGICKGVRVFANTTWDAGYELAVNPIKSVSAAERGLEQVYVDNGEGLSGRVALFNQANPLYHGLNGFAAANDARNAGDNQAAQCLATQETLNQSLFWLSPAASRLSAPAKAALANKVTKAGAAAKAGPRSLPIGPWGQKIVDARGKLPSSWGPGTPNAKGVGTRWVDPANSGNGIRIDQGISRSSFPSQQVDHVVVRSGGRILGPDGKPIVGSLRENPQAHIPLSDWATWSSWNSP
jgi:RHS repeat-associated protein